MSMTPEVLGEAAQNMLRRMGYATPPVDTAAGFSVDSALPELRAKERPEHDAMGPRAERGAILVSRKPDGHVRDANFEQLHAGPGDAGGSATYRFGNENGFPGSTGAAGIFRAQSLPIILAPGQRHRPKLIGTNC